MRRTRLQWDRIRLELWTGTEANLSKDGYICEKKGSKMLHAPLEMAQLPIAESFAITSRSSKILTLECWRPRSLSNLLKNMNPLKHTPSRAHQDHKPSKAKKSRKITKRPPIECTISQRTSLEVPCEKASYSIQRF